MKLEQVTDLCAASAPESPDLPPFDPADIAAHEADAHWRVVRDGLGVARCSLWWRRTPSLEGQAVGVIGHFAAVDRDCALRLLDHACAELAARGCAMAIGPMDGSTWRRYRLVTDRGAEPPFFLEPDNPDDWPGHFSSAGFAGFATYYSALCTDLGRIDPRLERVARRIETAGVAIRPIDVARFEEELAAIHALSLISFRDNLLYTPISLAQFVEQYRPIAALVRPELVLLAERRGELVGYLFAIPDMLQAKRGVPIDTIVVKTAAVLPGREYAGLGGLLVSGVHAVASSLGYARSIHALMHESNESRNLSGHYGAPFRRYTLYGKALSG